MSDDDNKPPVDFIEPKHTSRHVPGLEDDNEMDDETYEDPTPKVEKNIFKILFAKESRGFLIGYGIIILVIVIGAGVGYSKFIGNKNASAAHGENNQSTSGGGRVPNLDGSTAAYSQEMIAYNQSGQAEEKKKNPSAHPVLVTAKDDVDTSNNGFSSGAVDDAKCPVDIEFCKKAKSVGCDVSDTICLRAAGVIHAEECSPADNECLEKLKNTTAQERQDKYAERVGNKLYMEDMNKVLNTIQTERKQNVKIAIGAKPNQSLNKDSNQKLAKMDAENNGEVEQKAVNDVKTTKVQVEKISKPGDRFFGVSDIALNSKIQGPVSLTVLNGPYPMSKMLGKMTLVDEYLRLELDQWVLEDGSVCDIQAIALDKATTYAAVASNVDYHTLYRYGWWGVGTVLSAIGKGAEANANQQTVLTTGGAISTTESNTAREIKIGVGELGRSIGDVFKDRIKTPPTVTVKINEEMGIFILRPVTKDQCK